MSDVKGILKRCHSLGLTERYQIVMAALVLAENGYDAAEEFVNSLAEEPKEAGPEWFVAIEFPGYVLTGRPWRCVANCNTTEVTPTEAKRNAQLIAVAVNKFRESGEEL